MFGTSESFAKFPPTFRVLKQLPLSIIFSEKIGFFLDTTLQPGIKQIIPTNMCIYLKYTHYLT